MAENKRRMSVGAEPLRTRRGASFRVWAPDHARVELRVDGLDYEMDREGDGHFSLEVAAAAVGSRYGFVLPGVEGILPDPASRAQPDGPLGLSMVTDPDAFAWLDADWPGLGLHGQVIEELHVGTFTPEGTWLAAAEKLPLLLNVGISAVQLLPVAEFAGPRAWGDRPVGLFAPSHRYGTPEDLKAFVDRAHGLGMGVILGLELDRLGTEGLTLHRFDDRPFRRTAGGAIDGTLDLDGEGGAGMRRLLVENAAYWIREYRADGLAFAGIEAIRDRTILAECASACRAAAGGCRLLLAVADPTQDARAVRPIEAGGFGFDIIGNEDFERTTRVALGGSRSGPYADHEGSAAELAAATVFGFLFQGQRSAREGAPRGTPALDLPLARFAVFLETHAPVARAGGDRLARRAEPGLLRALTAVLLLGPQTPVLLQGQEFGSTRPFRCAETNDAAGSAPARGPLGPSVLDWSERDTNSGMLALHRDLIRIRRTDPVIAAQGGHGIVATTPHAALAAIRFIGPPDAPEHGDRLLLVNLGEAVTRPGIADPLFASGASWSWGTLWSSELSSYGGGGVQPVVHDGGWSIPARSAVLLAPLPASPRGTTVERPGASEPSRREASSAEASRPRGPR